MRPQALIHSLPIVASALGRKYKVNIVIGGDEAKTDGNTIVLPSLPPDSAEAAVLAYGYLDHEAGHVRLSDFSCFGECQLPLERSFLNIFEDIRIELEMSAAFPGCRHNLERLTRRLVADGVFGMPSAKDTTSAILHAYLLYRLRFEVLGQTVFLLLGQEAESLMRQRFPQFWLAQMEELLKKVGRLKSTQDALGLSRELIRLLKEEVNRPDAENESPQAFREESKTRRDSRTGPTGPEPTAQREGVSSTTSEESDLARPVGLKPKVSPNGTSPGNCESSLTNSTRTESCSVNSEVANTESQSRETLSTHREQGALRSATGDDGNYKEIMRELLRATEADIPKDFGRKVAIEMQSLAAANLPKSNVSPSKAVATSAIQDPAALLNGLRPQTRALRTRLEGALQALLFDRPENRRSGTRIDPRNLYRINLPNPKVFLRRVERKALNTAVQILLDSSSSMGKREIMNDALESALALALALDSVPRVHVACAAFPGANSSELIPLTRFGESVMQTASYYPSVCAHGSTPLAEAFWWVASQILLQPEERKLIVVITDGEPNSKEAAKDIITRCESSGIECLGVGIKYMMVRDLFKDFCIVSNIEELAPRLFGLLQKKLLEPRHRLS